MKEPGGGVSFAKKLFSESTKMLLLSHHFIKENTAAVAVFHGLMEEDLVLRSLLFSENREWGVILLYE